MNETKWALDCIIQPDGTLHVWPKWEENEHVLHGVSCECLCEVREFPSGKLVVHNSFNPEME